MLACYYQVIEELIKIVQNNWRIVNYTLQKKNKKQKKTWTSKHIKQTKKT